MSHLTTETWEGRGAVWLEHRKLHSMTAAAESGAIYYIISNSGFYIENSHPFPLELTAKLTGVIKENSIF